MKTTAHITAEMMDSILKSSFSSAVTQSDKNAARHLRDMLIATHGTYSSVLFEILQLTTGKDRTAVAEIAFLIGMQAGFELGTEYPSAKDA